MRRKFTRHEDEARWVVRRVFLLTVVALLLAALAFVPWRRLWR